MAQISAYRPGYGYGHASWVEAELAVLEAEMKVHEGEGEGEEEQEGRREGKECPAISALRHTTAAARFPPEEETTKVPITLDIDEEANAQLAATLRGGRGKRVRCVNEVSIGILPRARGTPPHFPPPKWRQEAGIYQLTLLSSPPLLSSPLLLPQPAFWPRQRSG